jgi:hypothetical protein
MLHRWLGYITVGEAILHSALYVSVAVEGGDFKHWSAMKPWYCASIALIALCLLIPFSIVALRRRAYEFFLITHISLSIIALVGAYYHISILFNTKWAGYVLYLWIAVCFWAIDRFARVIRIARNGLTRATVTVIDEEYIRVDIPKAKGHGHTYLYFPTLTWRFWENHPFSVATSPADPAQIPPQLALSIPSTLLPNSPTLSACSEKGRISSSSRGTAIKTPNSASLGKHPIRSSEEQNTDLTAISPISPHSAYFPSTRELSDASYLTPSATSRKTFVNPFRRQGDVEKRKAPESKGLTFFMRTHGGTTGLIRKRSSLPVLVESSYGASKDLSAYPVLICVAGGVGITAILPYLHAHKGTAKLFWGSRSAGLVSALREETSGFDGEILVDRRLRIKSTLQKEFKLAGDGVAIAVVVSGPKSMGDEVRAFVCEIARRRPGDIRFLDENFGW